MAFFDWLFGGTARSTRKRYTRKKLENGKTYVYDNSIQSWILYSMLTTDQQMHLNDLPVDEINNVTEDLHVPSFGALDDEKLTDEQISSAARIIELDEQIALAKAEANALGRNPYSSRTSNDDTEDSSSRSTSSGYSGGYSSSSSGYSSGSDSGGSCGGGSSGGSCGGGF